MYLLLAQEIIHCIKKLKNNINLLKVIAPKSLFKEINKKVFYLCPSNINSKEFISYIKNLKPDLILVAGFGKIFLMNLSMVLNVFG